MSPADKPLVWLHGIVMSPPFSKAARIEAGYLLRRLQAGESLGMPHSRPLPSVGRRCHELRIIDRGVTWRIVHRVDPDAIVILEVFARKTPQTPREVIAACRARLQEYDDA
jgi:phage-related protein